MKTKTLLACGAIGGPLVVALGLEDATRADYDPLRHPVSSLWSGALTDHRVERVREETARAAVEAADVSETPGVFEVALDEMRVALVVELVPDGYRFGWKTTVSMLPYPTTTLGLRSG